MQRRLCLHKEPNMLTSGREKDVLHKTWKYLKHHLGKPTFMLCGAEPKNKISMNNLQAFKGLILRGQI